MPVKSGPVKGGPVNAGPVDAGPVKGGPVDARTPLLPVDEACARILHGLAPGCIETCDLGDAVGRVLAKDLSSLLSLPSEPVSAMDGYAVRAADCATAGTHLTRIGESAAGHPWNGTLKAADQRGRGGAVRIFTGAIVPDGADTIVLQEDVDASSEEDGAVIIITEPPSPGQFIRPAGLDITAGSQILQTGTVMSARTVALAISAGHTEISVYARPTIGILSTGDELCAPGTTPSKGQIVSSNAAYLTAFVRACGGIPVDLGIAPDSSGEILDRVRAAPLPLNLITTTGGASVGTYDHVASDLNSAGTGLDFWKIAMRPGKPLIHGRIDDIPLLGLPGNPVSSAVCANIFLRPAIARLAGTVFEQTYIAARLTTDLGKNDQRQDYLRSTLTSRLAAGEITAEVTPAAKQDSSMISVYAAANALVVRPPFDPPRKAGDIVTVMPLDPLL